jgi:hypothetical protein
MRLWNIKKTNRDIAKNAMNKLRKTKRSGTASIRLCLADEKQMADPYTLSNKNILEDDGIRINKNIIEYLLGEIPDPPMNGKIVIEVAMPSINDEKLNHLKTLINNHVQQAIEKILLENKKHNFSTFLLTVFGMVVISIINIFPNMVDRYFLHELLIIVSWVFLWRAVELFFFMRANNNLQKVKLIRLYSAEYRIGDNV